MSLAVVWSRDRAVMIEIVGQTTGEAAKDAADQLGLVMGGSVWRLARMDKDGLLRGLDPSAVLTDEGNYGLIEIGVSV